MDLSFLQLLAFGLVAAAANVLGGLVVIPAGMKKSLRYWLKYLLAIGAGFMLGVTFFEIVPKDYRALAKPESTV